LDSQKRISLSSGGQLAVVFSAKATEAENATLAVSDAANMSLRMSGKGNEMLSLCESTAAKAIAVVIIPPSNRPEPLENPL
jgi:hypothetical protein